MNDAEQHPVVAGEHRLGDQPVDVLHLGAGLRAGLGALGGCCLVGVVLAAGAAIIFAAPSFWPVLAANAAMAVVGDVFRPAVESGYWTLAVIGVLTSVVPRMPDHQHGTTPVGMMPAGSGTYTLNPVNLYMAGYWEVTVNISATDAGGTTTTDSAMFPLCVPD